MQVPDDPDSLNWEGQVVEVEFFEIYEWKSAFFVDGFFLYIRKKPPTKIGKLSCSLGADIRHMAWVMEISDSSSFCILVKNLVILKEKVYARYTLLDSLQLGRSYAMFKF